MRRMIFCCLLSSLMLVDSPAAFAENRIILDGLLDTRTVGSGTQPFSLGQFRSGGKTLPPGQGLNFYTETFTTAEQVLAKCKVANCDAAVKEFINSLPEEKRVEAGRALAISLANLGQVGGAAKNNYVAALKELANQLETRDQKLSTLIFNISEGIASGDTVTTASLQIASGN